MSEPFSLNSLNREKGDEEGAGPCPGRAGQIKFEEEDNVTRVYNSGWAKVSMLHIDSSV
jgi:hypothetical protein